jgi:hypothetical protein
MKPLVHESLQAGLIENIVGQFFVGKHGQRSAFRASHELRGLFDRQIGVLADDRHHHAYHDLQATDLVCFLVAFIAGHIFQGASFPHPAPLWTGTARLDVPQVGGVALHSEATPVCIQGTKDIHAG